MVSGTASAAVRFQLLSSIETRPHRPDEIIDAGAPASWFTDAKLEILRTLRTPSIEDVPFVVRNTLVLGGLTPLRDMCVSSMAFRYLHAHRLYSVLPSLAAHRLPLKWWKSFVGEIRRGETEDGQEGLNGWEDPLFAVMRPA